MKHVYEGLWVFAKVEGNWPVAKLIGNTILIFLVVLKACKIFKKLFWMKPKFFQDFQDFILGFSGFVLGSE